MGIASIARTEQVEVATTCRKFATSDLGIVNCDEISMCLLSGRTTAASGPPSERRLLQIRVIGGSRSPLCSALTDSPERIQAIATPPTVAHSIRFIQFVEITQLTPEGVAVSTIRVSQKSPMPNERSPSGAPGRGPNNPSRGKNSTKSHNVQRNALIGKRYRLMNINSSKVR